MKIRCIIHFGGLFKRFKIMRGNYTIIDEIIDEINQKIYKTTKTETSWQPYAEKLVDKQTKFLKYLCFKLNK